MEVSLKPLESTWVLWFHDPSNKDYSFESYVCIGEIKCAYHLWAIFEKITPEMLISGMYFFMREGYRPMWESPENAGGGAWSKKINSTDSTHVFVEMIVNCASEELVISDFANTLVGVSISPKGPSSIIKIWNTNSKVNKVTCLNPGIALLEGGEGIAYTPHGGRPR